MSLFKPSAYFVEDDEPESRRKRDPTVMEHIEVDRSGRNEGKEEEPLINDEGIIAQNTRGQVRRRATTEEPLAPAMPAGAPSAPSRSPDKGRLTKFFYKKRGDDDWVLYKRFIVITMATTLYFVWALVSYLRDLDWCKEQISAGNISGEIAARMNSADFCDAYVPRGLIPLNVLLGGIMTLFFWSNLIIGVVLPRVLKD